MIVRNKDFAIASGAAVANTVPCNPGEQATGGGLSNFGGLTVLENRPDGAPGNAPVAWFVGVLNTTTVQETLTIWVVCAAP
jgi:hypothetical protein